MGWGGYPMSQDLRCVAGFQSIKPVRQRESCDTERFGRSRAGHAMRMLRHIVIVRPSRPDSLAVREVAAAKRNKNLTLVDKLRVNAWRNGCREKRGRIRTPSELGFCEVPYRPCGEMSLRILALTPSLATRPRFLSRFVFSEWR